MVAGVGVGVDLVTALVGAEFGLVARVT